MGLKNRFVLGMSLVLWLGCSSPEEEDPIFGGSPSSAVSAAQIAQWERAYAWGDHASAGYLTAEADPAFTTSPAGSIAEEDVSRWNAAHAWGSHSAAGYLTAETDPLYAGSPAASVTGEDLLRWNAAHAWGSHSAAGYLTAEIDPMYAGSPAASVTGEDLLRWDTASGWGDHAAVGYLTSEADPKVGALSTHAVPRWSGTQLENGALVDTGGNVGIGTLQPQAAFEVHTPSGSGTLDVAQNTFNAGLGSNRAITQTFKAVGSGNLVAVELQAWQAPGPLRLELRTATGTVLSATSCTNLQSGWFACRFPAPGQVSAGTMYELVIIPSGQVTLGIHGENPYADGELVWVWSGFDLAFRTYVAAPTVGPAVQVGTTVNVRALLNLQPMTEPLAAQAGDVYFDSASKRLRYFNGTAWVSL